MTDMAPTAGRLWKRMAYEQRRRAALAFWRDETIAADQAQAVQLIAKHKKFRPKTVAGRTPDSTKLGPAVAALTGAYPAEDVSICLNTLLCHDPDTWGALGGRPDKPA